MSKYFIECDQCGGSGFDTPGTGYGNVCGKCGGQKFLPVAEGEHDLPPIHVVVERTIENATIERLRKNEATIRDLVLDVLEEFRDELTVQQRTYIADQIARKVTT